MGFGEYVSASAEKDFATKQQAEEYNEVKEMPMEEIKEMVINNTVFFFKNCPSKKIN